MPKERTGELIAKALSDPHLHFWEHHNADGVRTKNSIEVLESILREASIAKVPVLFGGDLFHTPEGLKSPTINSVYPELIRLFNTYKDVDFYAISGNHDQYTHNYIHSPSISYTAGLANTIKNFHLLDFQGVVLPSGVGVYGIPFLYLNNNYSEAIQRAMNFFEEKKVNKTILLIHTTMEGSIDTNGYKLTESSVLLKTLSNKFTLVLSGHIHKHQKLAKGVYHIGSTSHVKASDAGYQPVYLDIRNPSGTKSLRVKPIEISKAFTFKYYTDIDDIDRSDNTIMWVRDTSKTAKDRENTLGDSTDITDLVKLMKGYLDSLGVKSPMRRKRAIQILKQVTDDTAD